MKDYDTIVATVQDEHADPILLAKIAYENPEFGANVAVNPRAYPGLKRWLAQFGDQRARDTLAQMGFTATPDPINERETPGTSTSATPSQPYESSYTQAAPAQVPPNYDPSTGMHAQPGSAAYTPVDSYSSSDSGSAAYTPVDSTPSSYSAVQPSPSTPSTYGYADSTPSSYGPVDSGQSSYGHSQPSQPIFGQSEPSPSSYGQSPQQNSQSVQPAHPVQPEAVQPSTNSYAQSQQGHTPVAAEASIQANNPYGFTVEQALDPSTDQMTIAKIAQYAPELRPCLARNPNTYPALLEWLAARHDPAIDAALAARNR